MRVVDDEVTCLGSIRNMYCIFKTVVLIVCPKTKKSYKCGYGFDFVLAQRIGHNHKFLT